VPKLHLSVLADFPSKFFSSFLLSRVQSPISIIPTFAKVSDVVSEWFGRIVTKISAQDCISHMDSWVEETAIPSSNSRQMFDGNLATCVVNVN
jgi:hypothetical protein